MYIGIVGHEAAKFTPETEAAARKIIRSLITPADVVVSGRCPLGGIDIWAMEEARRIGAGFIEYPPKCNRWADGFKPRNIQIAENSDVVVNIVVTRLPLTYTGMRFDHCYHCRTDAHVKSGGCWTMKYAARLGKGTLLYEVAA